MANPSLKVMTFNIRYGTANDGLNSWPYRREACLEMLKTSGCPIIGLQEVLKSQLEEILTVMPDYRYLGMGREDGIEDGEYSAILYDATVLTSSDVGWFWFSDTPEIPASCTWGNICTRICTHAHFSGSFGEFAFYNLHIDHESALSRSNSIDLLLSRISQRSNSSPVIVTGDFNDDETSAPIRKMAQAGFIDAYRSLHPDEPERQTYHGWEEVDEGPRIDYIFLQGVCLVEEATIDRRKFDGRFVSDHFPVTATLRLR